MVDVAIVNTSEELADVIGELLEEEGWSTARAYTTDFKRGRRDLSAFFRLCDPKVIVWDVALPYEENWHFFQTVRESPSAKGRRFVLTTTNAKALNTLVGEEVPALEIIGKPFDLHQLSAAVKQALAIAA